MLTDDEIDRVCDDFENAWLAGQTPDLGNLFSQVPKEAQSQLCEAIIPLDIEYRIKAGQKPSLEDYANFGEHAKDVALRELQPKVSPTVLPHLPSNATPRQIGPYKLLQILGEGGMGAVWMAEQEKPVRRRVALKLIKSGVDHKQIVARFEAERQAIALMDHPNIAKVLDAGTTEDGFPYFVMELVMGKPFNEYCDANQLTIDQRLELFIPVCNAVQHAHQKGIIHRDLKPNNILIALYDGRPVPKVIDFGLAKALQTQEKLTDKTLFTEFGLILGTIQYMSPEQAELNQIDIDTRTDIYSLGVILYELLTGTTPLDRDAIRGHAMLKVLEWVRQNEPPRPSVRLSSTSEKAASGISQQRQLELKKLKSMMQGELDWIVMKAIDKDRNRRYETANGFADDITRYLANGVVFARPPSKLYIAQKFVAKYRRIVLTACLVVSLLVLGLLGTGVMWYRATKSEVNLQNRANDASKTLFEFGEAEYAAGRYSSATEKLETAWRLRADDDPLKRKYGLSLVNLTSFGNRLIAQLHPSSDAYFVAFSPDGTRLATGSNWGTAQLWGVTSSAPIGEPMRHQELELPNFLSTVSASVKDVVTTVAFSPDGTRVATGSYDYTARIWDAATSAPIGEPMRHEGWVESVAFSPDGTRVATGSLDHTARIWDAATGAPIGVPMRHGFVVNSVAFSPDGTRVATASSDGTTRMWDAQSGVPIGEPMQNHGASGSAAFSPDGTRVVAGLGNNTARLWDAFNGALIGEPMRHDGWVTSLAFSPDGMRVATGTSNATAHIWDAATGVPIGESMRHEGWVTSVAFSPDGMRVATGSMDKTARLWDAFNGTPIGEPMRHDDKVHSVAFSPDGMHVATASKTARIWDTAIVAPVGQPMHHDGRINSIAFSPDGMRVATASKTARLWDAATGSPIGEPLRHEGSVSSVAFSPDGTRIATVSGDWAQIWDAFRGAPIGEPMRHEDTVHYVTFSPDGTRVATRSEDGSARVWDAATGVLVGTPMRHELWVNSVAFSPDGTRVATGSYDKTARVWDAATGLPISEPMRHEIEVNSVAFSPDGMRVATGSNDKTARIWDAASGAPIGEPIRHDSYVNSVSFSPDGMRVATGSDDNTARIWDAASGAPIGEPMRHEDMVHCVIFSPDGTRVTTQSGDDTVRIWDAATGISVGVQVRHKVRLDSSVSVAFSPDGMRVATVSGETTASIWDVEMVLPNSIEAFLNRFAKEHDQSIPRDVEYELTVEALRKNRLLRYRKSTVARAIQDHNWFAAAYHLPELIKAEPGDAKWLVMWEQTQLHLNAEKGAWNEAQKHALLRLDLEPSVNAFNDGLLCAFGTNDSDKIKSTVNQYLSFAEASDDPVIWNQIGLTSTLYTDESPPWDAISRLAAKAVESRPKSSEYGETLGGTLYRLRRFDEAKVALNRSLELAAQRDKEAQQTPPDVSAGPKTIESTDIPNASPAVHEFYVHAFLAMTYHQLKEQQKSREHRAQMDRIELEQPAREWRERLRRKLLTDEVGRTCGSVP